MAAQQAAVVAKKGLGMMFTASKVAAAALSAGVQKARKGYANQHETSVLNELKARGLTPVELVVESLKRFYFLMLAGYKHEIQAAATLCAKRLTDSEKSTVPLDVVIVFGGILYEESLKYGDFQKNALVQGMQDFLNKSRMGKDHYDRDSIAHDVYYSVLICAEEFEADWEQMQSCFRGAVTQMIEWAAANDVSPEARSRAAKSIFYLGQAVKASAQQGEERRQKSIKDAETTLRTEQGRRRFTPHSYDQSASSPASYQYHVAATPAQQPDQNYPNTSAQPPYQNYASTFGHPPYQNYPNAFAQPSYHSYPKTSAQPPYQNYHNTSTPSAPYY